MLILTYQIQALMHKDKPFKSHIQPFVFQTNHLDWNRFEQFNTLTFILTFSED